MLNTIKYNNSSTALHLAAEYNQPEIAKLLLDKGAGILINKYPHVESFSFVPRPTPHSF